MSVATAECPCMYGLGGKGNYVIIAILRACDTSPTIINMHVHFKNKMHIRRLTAALSKVYS